MRNDKHTMILAGIIITAIIIGVISFRGSKSEIKVKDKITITRTTRTTTSTTSKATMKIEDEEIITVEECDDLISTLKKNPSAYSLENIKNCGYENVYNKYTITRRFNSANINMESLSVGLPKFKSSIDVTISNNTHNINFELYNNNEKTNKTEKIAGVTKTLYDINVSTNELNIFFITNNGVYRFYVNNSNMITKYSLDKISNNPDYQEIVVNRIGINKNDNIYYFKHNNKYINIVTNTTEKNLNNIFYEDNIIKINTDRTIYINGSVKPFKVNYYITDSSNKITNIIDSDGYLYGYVDNGKQIDFPKIDMSRISEILLNKNKVGYNRYGRIITIENDKPNFIIIFSDNSLSVLDYEQDIPLLKN